MDTPPRTGTWRAHFLRGEKPMLTFDDGFEVVQILMAAYMSAKKGKTMEFPPAGLEASSRRLPKEPGTPLLAYG